MQHPYTTEKYCLCETDLCRAETESMETLQQTGAVGKYVFDVKLAFFAELLYFYGTILCRTETTSAANSTRGAGFCYDFACTQCLEWLFLTHCTTEI